MTLICLLIYTFLTVSEYRWDVHAHLQPHLHDAAAWSLEWLFTVLGSHVTRLSARHVGCH